jgi:hypothetical protein
VCVCVCVCVCECVNASMRSYVSHFGCLWTDNEDQNAKAQKRKKNAKNAKRAMDKRVIDEGIDDHPRL